MNHEHAQDSLDQINLEYRAIVLGKLDRLETGQEKLASDIVQIKTSFAQQHELKEIREKVTILENFKFKFVGSLLTLQVILTILGFLANRFLKP